MTADELLRLTYLVAKFRTMAIMPAPELTCNLRNQLLVDSFETGRRVAYLKAADMLEEVISQTTLEHTYQGGTIRYS
jgi:hypothetical protein